MVEYINQRKLLLKLMENGCSASVIDIVLNFPAADVAPVVHGRWIEQEDPCGDPYYTCSACKDDFYIEMTGAVEKDLFLYSYCPSCGAKMDGRGEKA